LLFDSLLAYAMFAVATQETELDPRDVMVSLSYHHIVTAALGQRAATVFNEVADRLPPGPTPDLLREFGARDDVTPKSFGWHIADTPDGPVFVSGSSS
jgi:hypothetical protein